MFTWTSNKCKPIMLCLKWRLLKKKRIIKIFEKYKYLIIELSELEFNDKFINSNINEKQIDKSRIAVLGSLRYSSEWIKHIDEFTPRLIKNNNKKRCFYEKIY